jgi:hypothetical protein
MNERPNAVFEHHVRPNPSRGANLMAKADAQLTPQPPPAAHVTLPAHNSVPRRRRDAYERWPAHPFDRLPFVSLSGGEFGRNFWAPRPTGDYVFDCTLGEQYAAAAMPMLARHDDLLCCMMLAMVRHGDLEREKGVMVGILSAIGREFAARARR